MSPRSFLSRNNCHSRKLSHCFVFSANLALPACQTPAPHWSLLTTGRLPCAGSRAQLFNQQALWPLAWVAGSFQPRPGAGFEQAGRPPREA